MVRLEVWGLYMPLLESHAPRRSGSRASLPHLRRACAVAPFEELGAFFTAAVLPMHVRRSY